MRTPYRERTDLDKLRSQWRKLKGLKERREWSAAALRGATAVELSLNFAIRREFVARSTFDAVFVDSLLRWANGAPGKLRQLLLPLLTDAPERHRAAQALVQITEQVAQTRNAIVHSGEFCNEEEALAVIEGAERVVLEVVRWYDAAFDLTTEPPKSGR